MTRMGTLVLLALLLSGCYLHPTAGWISASGEIAEQEIKYFFPSGTYDHNRHRLYSYISYEIEILDDVDPSMKIEDMVKEIENRDWYI